MSAQLFPPEDDLITVCKDGTCDFQSIEAAEEAAHPGARIEILNGTYDESVTVDTESVTIAGLPLAGVQLDAPVDQRAMTIEADGVTLSGLTIDGPEDPSQFGVHASNATGDQRVCDLTIRDVTVEDSGRSELDLHGACDTLVEDSKFLGNDTAGVGLAITDSLGVEVRNVTTSGNDWGGIAIFTSGDFIPGGTSGVNVTDTTHDENPPLYTQTHDGHEIRDLHLPAFDHRLDQNDLPTFTFYYQHRETAIDTAPDCDDAGSSVWHTNDDGTRADHAHVDEPMCIEPAADSASLGDEIRVRNGTYEEGPITLGVENLTVEGINQTAPQVIADSDEVKLPNKFRNHKPTVAIRAPGITLDNLDLIRNVSTDAAIANGDGHTKVLGVKDSDTTIRDSSIVLNDETGNDDKNTALWVANLFNEDTPAIEGTTIENVDVDGDANAVGVFSLSTNGVNDTQITGSSIADANVGLFTGTFQDRGDVTNVSVEGTAFTANRLQVLDPAEGTQLCDLPGANDFDAAVTLRCPAEDPERVIWSVLQEGVDNATAGDTVQVYDGEYQGTITGFAEDMTIVGPEGPEDTVVTAESGGAFDVQTDGVTLESVTWVGDDSRVKGAEDVRLEANTIVGTPDGLDVDDAQVVLENNQIEADTVGTGNATLLEGDGADGSVVANNTFEGFENGTTLDGVQDVEVRSNNFVDLTEFGIRALSEGRVVHSLTLDNNDFTNVGTGILTHENREADGPSVVHSVSAHFNTFQDVPVGILGVRTSADGDTQVAGPTGTLDGTHNWWGTPAGPIPANQTGQQAGFALAALTDETAPVSPLTVAGGNVDTAPACAIPTCETQRLLHDVGPHPHVPPVKGPGPAAAIGPAH